MDANTNIFSEKEKINWLKACIALSQLKETLVRIVETASKEVNATLDQINGNCSQGLCKTKKQKNQVKQKIKSLHRYNTPSWQNTKTERRKTDIWEIGKRYLPRNEYKHVSAVQELDLNGIISVVYNCKHFESYLSSSLLPEPPDPQCPLEKVLQIGQVALISTDCKVTDADLQNYIQTLARLLRDPNLLKIDSMAKLELTQLRLLQNDVFSQDELIELFKDASQSLKLERFSEVAEGTFLKALLSIKATDAGKQVMTTLLWNSKQHLDMPSLPLNGIERLQQVQTDQAVEDFEQDIDEMRRLLKKHYQESLNHSTTSSINDCCLEKLGDIYLPPKLMAVDKLHFKKTGKHITEYKNIFVADGRLNKKSFIQGEAGTGKSTFLSKLVMDWCCITTEQLQTEQITRPDTGAQTKCSFVFQDLNTLQLFKFVFHITLRNSMKQFKISEMIKEQLIDEIFSSEEDREKAFILLNEIMKRECCLVLLDGLDEWTSPLDGYGLPTLAECHTKCIQLVTTRPWKLADGKVSHSDINTLMHLEGVNEPIKLSRHIMSCLVDRNELENKYAAFNRYVQEQNLYDLLLSPIMLRVMVCLFAEGMTPKVSNCKLNCLLLEHLLKKTNSEISDFQHPPFRCFAETQYIQPNIVCLNRLAEAAFHLLFSKTRENSLVFGMKEVYQYKLVEQLDVAFKSGIVSVTRKKSALQLVSSFSFIHKSLQEFLAAYHIACNTLIIESVISGYLKRCDSSYLDVTQVFIFLCGLDISAANKLSEMLNECDQLHNKDNKFNSSPFQHCVLSGYREAVANGQTGINLKLSNFNIDDASIHPDLHSLWVMNASNAQSLRVTSSLECKKPSIDFELSSCQKLKVLKIYGNGICLKDAVYSAECVSPVRFLLNHVDPVQHTTPVLPSIEHIELGDVTCSASWLRCLFSILKTVQHTVKSVLEDCEITMCMNGTIHYSYVGARTEILTNLNGTKIELTGINHDSDWLWEALRGLHDNSFNDATADFGDNIVRYTSTVVDKRQSNCFFDEISNDGDPQGRFVDPNVSLKTNLVAIMNENFDMTDVKIIADESLDESTKLYNIFDENTSFCGVEKVRFLKEECNPLSLQGDDFCGDNVQDTSSNEEDIGKSAIPEPAIYYKHENTELKTEVKTTPCETVGPQQTATSTVSFNSGYPELFSDDNGLTFMEESISLVSDASSDGRLRVEGNNISLIHVSSQHSTEDPSHLRLPQPRLLCISKCANTDNEMHLECGHFDVTAFKLGQNAEKNPKMPECYVSEQDLDRYASVMVGKLPSTSKAHKSNSRTEVLVDTSKEPKEEDHLLPSEGRGTKLFVTVTSKEPKEEDHSLPREGRDNDDDDTERNYHSIKRGDSLPIIDESYSSLPDSDTPSNDFGSVLTDEDTHTEPKFRQQDILDEHVPSGVPSPALRPDSFGAHIDLIKFDSIPDYPVIDTIFASISEEEESQLQTPLCQTPTSQLLQLAAQFLPTADVIGGSGKGQTALKPDGFGAHIDLIKFDSNPAIAASTLFGITCPPELNGTFTLRGNETIITTCRASSLTCSPVTETFNHSYDGSTGVLEFFKICNKSDEDVTYSCTLLSSGERSNRTVELKDGSCYNKDDNIKEANSPMSLSSQPMPVNLELLVSVDLPKTGDDEKEPLLNGLDFLHDGRLVAVDNHNKKCIIMNERLQRLGTPYKFKGNTITLTREIKTSSSFDSICCMSPSNMVASTYDNPCPARMISVDGVESGFDHSLTFPMKTYKIAESSCTYVQSKNTLVLTDRYAHTVYMNDTVKGTSRAVTNENIQEPRAACVEPGDSVLVCSMRKDSIMHLTIDGHLQQNGLVNAISQHYQLEDLKNVQDNTIVLKSYLCNNDFSSHNDVGYSNSNIYEDETELNGSETCSSEPKDETTLDSRDKFSSEPKDVITLDSKDTWSSELRGETTLDSRNTCSSETKDETTLDTKDKWSSEPKDLTSLDSRDKYTSEPKDETTLNSLDKCSSEPKDETTLDSRVKCSSEAKDETTMDSMGTCSSEPKDEAILDSRDKYTSEPKDETTLISRDKCPSKPIDETTLYSRDKCSSQPKDEIILDSIDRCSSEPKDETTMDSMDNCSSEIKDETTLDSREKCSSEPKDETTLDSRDKCLSESKDEKILDSRNKCPSGPKDETNLDLRDKCSSEAKGEKTLDSRDKLSSEPKDETTLDSRDKCSSEPKDETTLDSRDKCSSDPKDDTTVDSIDKCSSESKDKTLLYGIDTCSSKFKDETALVRSNKFSSQPIFLSQPKDKTSLYGNDTFSCKCKDETLLGGSNTCASKWKDETTLDSRDKCSSKPKDESRLDEPDCVICSSNSEGETHQYVSDSCSNKCKDETYKDKSKCDACSSLIQFNDSDNATEHLTMLNRTVRETIESEGKAEDDCLCTVGKSWKDCNKFKSQNDSEDVKHFCNVKYGMQQYNSECFSCTSEAVREEDLGSLKESVALISQQQHDIAQSICEIKETLKWILSVHLNNANVDSHKVSKEEDPIVILKPDCSIPMETSVIVKDSELICKRTSTDSFLNKQKCSLKDTSCTNKPNSATSWKTKKFSNISLGKQKRKQRNRRKRARRLRAPQQNSVFGLHSSECWNCHCVQKQSVTDGDSIPKRHAFYMNDRQMPHIQPNYVRQELNSDCFTSQSSTETDSWLSYRRVLREHCEKTAQRHIARDVAQRLYIEHAHQLHGTVDVYGLRSFFNRVNTGTPLTHEEQMQFEWLRFITFSQYEGEGNGIGLARNGFYHCPELGPNATRCFACDIVHEEWTLLDNVEQTHQRLSPSCPLLRNNSGEGTRRNISIAADDGPQRAASTANVNVRDASATGVSQSPAATSTSQPTPSSSISQPTPSGSIFPHGHSPANFNHPPTPETIRQLDAAAAARRNALSASNTQNPVSPLTERLSHAQITESEEGPRSILAQPTEDPENRQAHIHRAGYSDQDRSVSGIRPSDMFGGGPVGHGAFAAQSLPVTTPQPSQPLRSSSAPLTNLPLTTETVTRSSSSATIAGSTQTTTTPPQQTAVIQPSETEPRRANVALQRSSTPLKTVSAVLERSSQPRGPDDPRLNVDLTTGIYIERPRHPEYNNLQTRIDTFTDWPAHLDQDTRQLAELGFFHVGVADFVRCFACGGGLRNWERGDNPLVEHIRWFPNCEYMRKLKGQHIIDLVLRHVREQEAAEGAAASRTSDLNTTDPLQSELGRSLIDMGFTEDQVKDGITGARQRLGRTDVTANEVIDWLDANRPPAAAETKTQLRAVVRQEERPVQTGAPTTTTTSSSTTTTTSSSSRSGTTLTTSHSQVNVEVAVAGANITATATTATSVTAGGNNDDDEEYETPPEGNTSGQAKNGGKKKKKRKSKGGNAASKSSNEGATTQQTENLDPAAIQKENERLRDMQTCKICMERPVDTTLLPCGHLVTCNVCAQRLAKCPICRKKKEGAVRTFMS